MGKYASKTDVGSDRSRAEIERTLKRYGARSFMHEDVDYDPTLGGDVHVLHIMHDEHQPARTVPD